MRVPAADLIANHQLKWAIEQKISLAGRYTKKLEDNLFDNTLDPQTRKEYQKGKGHELEGKRAHMKALHSSSALVVNVFDYWRCQDMIQDMAGCCGVEGVVSGMQFEKTHPIKGVTRTPPHLDVEFAGRTPLAIESKFTETYHRTTRRDDKDTHLDKYLEHPELWNGISRVRALAESIVGQSGSRTDFEYLDVPQLIKHILGLWGCYGSSFCLLYLWYKVNSPEANRHEGELARFSTGAKDEISFRAMTYQNLFSRIRHVLNVDSAYIEYLEKRYFPQVNVVATG
jgi:hypothetical protein